MYLTCSRNLRFRFRLVCPTYDLWQVLHVILYIPLFFICPFCLFCTTQIQTSQHEKSGIYKITCKTCPKSYVGQTNRNLNLRFREHVRYIKNNDPLSAYALHIFNCRHEYGNISDTMTLRNRLTSHPFYFHTSKCMYRFSVVTMNSFLSNIRANTIPRLNSSSTHPARPIPAWQLINISVQLSVRSQPAYCTAVCRGKALNKRRILHFL